MSKSNIYELLDIRERNKDEWKTHIVALKQKFVHRRNSPDIEKQQEASNCLSAISCIERVLDEVPDGSEWTTLAIKVALHYHETDQFDKELHNIIAAVNGNKESILHISNTNLSQQLKLEWDGTIAAGLVNTKKTGSQTILLVIVLFVILLFIFIIIKSCGNGDSESKTDDVISETSEYMEDEGEISITETPTATPTTTPIPTTTFIPTITPTPTEEPSPVIPQEKSLLDFDMKDKYMVKIQKGIVDVDGEEHESVLTFATGALYDREGKPYYVKCNLYKEFSMFSGDVGYFEPTTNYGGTQKEIKKFQIFGDDIELYSIDIDKDTSLTHFEIDVSDVKVLEMRYADGHGYNNAMIVNGSFKRK